MKKLGIIADVISRLFKFMYFCLSFLVHKMTDFTPRLQISDGVQKIFDIVRKKFVALTPEELVRQQLLHFLTTHKKFPIALLQVETALQYNNKNYRADIIANDRMGKPLMIAECKAPEIEISQKTFEQIARYNLVLKVPFLLITNGQQHFFCRFDAEKNNFCFEEEFSNYDELIKSI